MKRCSFFAFLIGIFTGVLVGLLIAPDKGENTRKIIKEKTKDTNENFKKRVKDAKYDISGVKDSIKDTITLYTGSSIEEVDEDNYFEKEFDVE